MLNRRFLRIKVYQALYAHAQSAGGSAAKNEKELLLGVERTYDLFIHVMMLFGEMRRLAEERLEERKAKRMPTGDDLAPSRRFVDNPFLVKLSESKLLLQESEKRKTGWVGDRDLLMQLQRVILASDEYAAYIVAPRTTPAIDRAVILDLFVEHIAQFESLHEHVEAKSIHWLEDLDLACSMVKRVIETMKIEDPDLMLMEPGSEAIEERAFVTTLYRDTIAHQEADEKIIAERASNWEADRIALSDMLLMRMALTEARSFDLIPVKVTLNEYIEVAKAYSTPKSKNFINGILDKLFAEMKDSGAIHKVGRGLLES
ncbi:MAG: transcription antitermination protein NusB [Flavobacteriales bacterium]|jgi:N utilization substance protein B|nr:transcription antitermination protein NusB [Flavobacteriales bacterium]MBK7288470.1 transcription antitermination protein NusB [Flavobacteriales bacterium]MBK9059700.1 transcription antitermination protein NusB [Flavobacteriales bacterium]MBK9598475.1 transcription antitermination protein NusB [Flavobacteriales bacterium]QQS73384.1 MAG: transcription antitermination protein NusB [Flavobacteriales bacterium]